MASLDLESSKKFHAPQLTGAADKHVSSSGDTSASASVDGAYVDKYGEFVAGGPVTAFASTGHTSAPSPSLSLDVTATSIDESFSSAHASASADLLYWFEINGPDGQVMVNMTAAGGISSALTDWKYDASASASLRIFPLDDPGHSDYYNAVQYFGSPTEQFHDNVNITFTANRLYNVKLSATESVWLRNGHGGSGSIFTTIDPVFSLSQADAAKYSLIFSPGIGNSAVPEPSTWALMIGGFGLAGTMLRRRRTVAA